MEEGIGEEKLSMSAVVIFLIVVGILVVFAVIGTVVMGVLFLWGSSLTETETSFTALNFQGEIDGNEDTLTLTMLSGTSDWSELQVIVEGITLTTTTTTASAGQDVVFSSPSWDPVPGTTYMVNVVSISDNMPLWGRSIRAQ